MARTETALDRLERTKAPSTEREYTLEEQMDSVSTDDFLDGMSDVAKDNLGHLFEEVTPEDEIETSEEEVTPVVDSSVTPMITTPAPTPVVVETPIVVDVPAEATESDDELFNNNNMKPKRRSRKTQDEPTSVGSSAVSSCSIGGSSNPVLDQLAKDVIDDLRNRCHKINRFDDKSMEMIFDYMYSKF